MKYIPLQGQPCKLDEIHTLGWATLKLYGQPLPVNYMKYIPLQGQPCKLYEIHTLIWKTL